MDEDDRAEFSSTSSVFKRVQVIQVISCNVLIDPSSIALGAKRVYVFCVSSLAE